MCFFCKEAIANGIPHKHQQQRASKASQRKREKEEESVWSDERERFTIVVHVIGSID